MMLAYRRYCRFVPGSREQHPRSGPPEGRPVSMEKRATYDTSLFVTITVTAPRESPRMSSLSRHRHRADTTRCYCKYTSNRHAPRHRRATQLLNRHRQAIGTRLVSTAPRDC
ncbi:hypothetical protein J6590_067781 [Homalodisca vitripennis]|nr:hypothetical protein J6590_067781 [Homalodisca vitripennis]